MIIVFLFPLLIPIIITGIVLFAFKPYIISIFKDYHGFINYLARRTKFNSVYDKKSNRIEYLQLIKEDQEIRIFSKKLYYNSLNYKKVYKQGLLITINPLNDKNLYGFFLIFSKNNIINNLKNKIITGAAEFDKMIIECEQSNILNAKLSDEIRKALIDLSESVSSIEIYESYITIKYNNTERTLENVKKINKIIEKIILFSKELSKDTRIDKLLIENIKNDKNKNVKLINMNYLLSSPKLNNYKDFLTQLLKNENIILQIMAAFGLGKNGTESLLKILTENKKIKFPYIINEFKFKLIEYLGNLKDERAIPWLSERLKEKYQVQINTIKALEKIGDIKAVEYLIPIAKGTGPDNIINLAQNVINKLQGNVPKDYEGDLMISDTANSGELSIEDNNQDGKLTME